MMNSERSTAWIGLQKTQTSINALKEEVEEAEKKLLASKKCFYKSTRFRLDSWSNKPDRSVKAPELNKQNSFHKTILHKVSSLHKAQRSAAEKGDADVTKFLDLSEEPILIPPSLMPPVESLASNRFGNFCNDSFLDTSLSTDSAKSDYKLSSEATSSLIASTYQNAPELRQKTEVHKTPLPLKVSAKNENLTSSFIQTLAASSFSSSDMEWKPVNGNKVTQVSSHLKSDSILKLHGIIELQKKRQEAYQKQLENQPMYNHEPSDSAHTDYTQASIPTRKVCHVKSFPSYKGFCSPPNKKWNLHKRKSSVVKTTPANSSGRKKMRKIIHCNSESIESKEKTKNDCSDDKTPDAETLKPSSPDFESRMKTDVRLPADHYTPDAEVKENVPPVSVKELLSSSSEEEICSSRKIEIQLPSSKKDSNIYFPSSSGTSKSSYKSTNVKQSVAQPSVKKVVSPKIRNYDVQKVRDYIRKKKDERRRRFQEDLKNRNYKAQKKKECLEKLILEQKQALLTKKKSLAPSKEKETAQRVARNASDSLAQNGAESKSVKNSNASLPHSVDARVEKKDTLKNDSKADCMATSPKKNPSHLHIDICMPKFTPTSQNKNALSPPKETNEKKSANDGNLLEVNGNVLSEEVLHQIHQPDRPSEMHAEADSPFPGFGGFQDSFQSISSINSLSDLNQIPGFDPKIVQALQPSKSKVKPVGRKCKVLKDLMKSINEATKPLEPLLRVKEWVQANSLPDKVLLNPYKTAESNEKQLKSQSALKSVSKESGASDVNPAIFNKRTFKEHVSGIGDVSVLYEKILGKPSTSSSLSNNGSHKMDVVEDNHQSSKLSSFSDLQMKTRIPDPFNVVNTWSRKPVDLLKSQQKNLLSTPVCSENLASKDQPLASFDQVDSSTSMLKTDTVPPAPVSPVNNLQVESSPSKVSDYQSSFEKEASKESSEASPSKPSSEPEKSPNSFSGSIENLSKHTTSKDEDDFTDRAASKAYRDSPLVPREFPGENSDKSVNSEALPFENLNESVSSTSDDSGTLVSGSITSEYSLEKDESDSEAREIAKDGQSLSRSSESEVISVVENSKGLQSSSEDLLSAKEASLTQHSIISSHPSETGHSGTVKSFQTEKASKNESSATVHSRNSSSRTSKSQKRMNQPTRSKAPGPTIEFHQPLGLANGLDSQGTYLHTQVVTRLASEAAAAAATSAVMAVFETQRMLLAEKNLPIPRSLTRSSSSKKTQYSSDFESSPQPKSSVSSSDSAEVAKDYEEPVREERSEDSENEMPDESTLHESSVPKSLHSDSESSVHTEPNLSSKSERSDGEIEERASTNHSSPALKSLSESEPLLSSTAIDSHFLQNGDSFSKLTLDVIRQMTYDEEVRARHQLSLLQIQEKALVEKARAEMLWLQMLKKKLKEKGADSKVSSIKRKQKELLSQLRHERVQLHRMQETYKNICERQKSSYSKWLTEEEKFLSSSISEGKLKDSSDSQSSSFHSNHSAASKNGIKSAPEDNAALEVSESIKQRLALQESASISDLTKASTAKSEQVPKALSHSTENHSNPSVSSTEKVVQGLKKIEASKRHLTKREQRIFHRRKQVESLLQWQMKLDKEEMAVRELEQKAVSIVDFSKKRSKYYVSSSGSTNQEDDKTANSPEKSDESLNQSNKISATDSSIKSNHGLGSKTSFSASEASIEELSTVEKCMEISKTTGSSVSEEIRSGSHDSSIQTVENSSQLDVSVSEEIPYQVSPAAKEKSSSSDIYSESFESSTSMQASVHGKAIKSGSPGIRLPLVPRNMKRHDSSGSDDSYTISQSETASDQSDLEVRIHALAEELRIRRKEAEQLKKERKRKYREHLKEKELSLQKQIEAYNQFIEQVKSDLDHQMESGVSVKPFLKRSPGEGSGENRYKKKQGVIPSEKKSYTATRSSKIVSTADEKSVKLSVSEVITENQDVASSKDASSVGSKEVSEVMTDSSAVAEVEVSEATTQLSGKAEESYFKDGVTTDLSNSAGNSSEFKSVHSDSLPLEVSSGNENRTPFSSEAKSESDTFVSDSQSSKSSDASEGSKLPTTPELSDALASKKESENGSISYKSSEGQGGREHSSKKGSLSDSSSSTVQTESKTSSDEREISECSGPHGCEETSSNNASNIESGNNLAKSDSCLAFSDSSSNILKKKFPEPVPEHKKRASDSFIVHLVNSLYTNFLDEAVRAFLDIRILKRPFREDLHFKSSLKIGGLCSKPVDGIVQFLFDSCFNDTFHCIFSVYRQTKKTYHQSVLNQAVINNSCLTYEYRNKTFDKSYCSQPANEIQLLDKNAKWGNLDKQGLSSKEQFHILELQVPLHQYSYYYRKIPNKPPPPYTPPTKSSDNFPPSEAPVQKITSIKEITHNIDRVLDLLVDKLVEGKKIGSLSLSDISLPSNEVKETLGLANPSQSVFVDLVFDLTKEIILEKYNESEPKPQPWLRPQKLTPKSLIPASKEVIRRTVDKEVKAALKITQNLQKQDSFRSAMKLGRKKRDFVDTILISELKEEECDWVNCDEDEMTVKLQIADFIFNNLIDDSVQWLKHFKASS